MRVLLSCLQSSKAHNIPAYGFWRGYFVNGLREAGHEIVEVPNVDWAEALIDADEKRLGVWRTHTWETVAAFVRDEIARRPIHLFLSYLYPQQIERTAIRTLQGWGIPCVNFFCDNVREFRTLPAEFDCFDLHWVPEYEALPMYRKANLPHIHAPMPCWVAEEYRDFPANENAAVIFIGSRDHLRRRLLSDVARLGANIAVYGNGWSDSVGPPSVDTRLTTTMFNQVRYIRSYGIAAFGFKTANWLCRETGSELPSGMVGDTLAEGHYAEAIRTARISIGINRVSSHYALDRKPRKYSRLRDIEAPMLGACYLTEWTEGLSQLYDLGREIETYRTGEEMAAKIDELRRNNERRRGMRRAAQTRALSDHAISRSFDRICKAII
jgi:Glycosyl transferases group 1